MGRTVGPSLPPRAGRGHRPGSGPACPAPRAGSCPQQCLQIWPRPPHHSLRRPPDRSIQHPNAASPSRCALSGEGWGEHHGGCKPPDALDTEVTEGRLRTSAWSAPGDGGDHTPCGGRRAGRPRTLPSTSTNRRPCVHGPPLEALGRILAGTASLLLRFPPRPHCPPTSTGPGDGAPPPAPGATQLPWGRSAGLQGHLEHGMAVPRHRPIRDLHGPRCGSRVSC